MIVVDRICRSGFVFWLKKIPRSLKLCFPHRCGGFRAALKEWYARQHAFCWKPRPLYLEEEALL